MRGTFAAVTLAVLAVAACQSQTAPRFERQIAWQGRGVWLRADTHIHTRFSDGGHQVEDVVAKARSFGCDVVGITDHADRGLKGATPEYFAAIAAARQAHADMVILAGLEWNVPPWNGEEHATVLVAPGAEPALAEFKSQFDDLGLPEHNASLAADGLRWLAAHTVSNGIKPVVIYQHPSRADAQSIENVDDIKAWRTVNDLVIGFAGAPGHQGGKSIGSYNYKEKPIDRWDPVAARVGDAWDTLLQSGLDVWAADAPSDFHTEDPNDLNDYWPCQFSETWVYAPSRDAAGVLQALRAGSYFGDHGRFVRNVELTVTTPGLPRPATSGEAIAVSASAPLQIVVNLQVPPTAWGEGANSVESIEIIGVSSTGAKIVASGAPAAEGPALSQTLRTPPGGIVLRARGYRRLASGERFAFYTNPVRVKAPK